MSTALVYAGFWRRFGAFWIDFLVFLPLFPIVYFGESLTRLFQLFWFLPGLLIGLWFHVYLVQRYGGTPGKLLLRMRITMVDGSPVTTRAAFLRYVVLFVLAELMVLGNIVATFRMSDAEFFSLGLMERTERLAQLAPAWYGLVNVLMQIWIWSEFVTMLFNKKRRAIHDLMAGTVVIKV